jgi:hypothetical protein
MVTATMVADLDSMSGSQANQSFYAPIARVVPHSLKLLVDSSHWKYGTACDTAGQMKKIPIPFGLGA